MSSTRTAPEAVTLPDAGLQPVRVYANLTAAQATAELNRVNLERAKELWDRKAVAKSDFDAADAAAKASVATVAAIEAQIAKKQVRAPFAGRVGIRQINVGQFVVALDVSRFLPLDVFKAEIDRHIHDIASSKPLPGVDKVRVPGQGRLERRIERERDGVPLSTALLKQVDEVANSLGVTPLSART